MESFVDEQQEKAAIKMQGHILIVVVGFYMAFITAKQTNETCVAS